MRQHQGQAPPNGQQGSNFTVFRAPGQQQPRYPPSTLSSGSIGSNYGGPMTASIGSNYGAPMNPSVGSNYGVPMNPSIGSVGSNYGVPMGVGPSPYAQPSEMSGSGGHRNSASTVPSSPFRESIVDGLDDGEDGGMNWMRTGRIVRVKETGESYRFPLEEENLPKIELSRHDIAQLQARMEASVDRAARNGGVSWMENPTLAPINSKHQWKTHMEKKQCIMYRRKNDPTLTRHFLIRSKVDGAMNDVMYGVMSDNTEDERTALAHCYRDDFLDGAVLQLLARPTTDDPYHIFAVKWAAFQSPVDSMYAIRDIFYVEYSRTVVDAKGQKVVARIFQSINPKDYAVAELDYGFARNEISWFQLFRSVPGSNDTKVDVSISGAISFASTSNTPSWLANRFLTSMYTLVNAIGTAGDAKHIVNQSLMSEKPWVPNSERSACNVCLKSFGFLRHRHHCRICAEIMCTACTLEVALRSSKLPPSLRPEGGLISAEKFCYKCIQQGRKDRGDMVQQMIAYSTAAASIAKQMDSFDGKENVISSQSDTYHSQSGSSAHSGSYQHNGNYGHSGSYGHNEGYNDYYPPSRSGSSSSSEWSYAAPPPVPVSRMAPTGEPTSQKVIAMRQYRQNGSMVPYERVPAPDGSMGMEKINLSGGNYGREQFDKSSIGMEKIDFNAPSNMNPSVFHNDMPRESEEVMNVTPIPSSFARMEESIAAQQMLLRNMVMEGQKMMQNQPRTGGYQQPRGPPPMMNNRNGSHMALPPPQDY